jgi:hypothetical protein
MGSGQHGCHAWALRSAAESQTARHGVRGRVHTLRLLMPMISSRGLTWRVKARLPSGGWCRGSHREDGGGGTTPLCRTQTRQVLRRSAGSLLVSWQLELCLGKENAGASKDYLKNFEIVSTEISSPCKNSFGQTIGVPKIASTGERPVSSLGCARRTRSTQGISSVQVAAAAQARSASLKWR